MPFELGGMGVVDPSDFEDDEGDEEEPQEDEEEESGDDSMDDLLSVTTDPASSEPALSEDNSDAEAECDSYSLPLERRVPYIPNRNIDYGLVPPPPPPPPVVQGKSSRSLEDEGPAPPPPSLRGEPVRRGFAPGAVPAKAPPPLRLMSCGCLAVAVGSLPLSSAQDDRPQVPLPPHLSYFLFVVSILAAISLAVLGDLLRRIDQWRRLQRRQEEEFADMVAWPHWLESSRSNFHSKLFRTL